MINFTKINLTQPGLHLAEEGTCAICCDPVGVDNLGHIVTRELPSVESDRIAHVFCRVCTMTNMIARHANVRCPLCSQPIERVEDMDSSRFNFISAAEYGDLDVINALLPSSLISIGMKNDALDAAAATGHLGIVNALIRNMGRDAEVSIPLIVAAIGGHFEVVDVLNRSEQITTRIRESALIPAAENGHSEVVNILLRDDAIKGWNRGRALWRASANGHLEIVNRFLHDERILRAHRGLALAAAIENRHRDIADILLQQDGMRIGAEAGPALVIAASRGMLQIVTALCRNQEITAKKKGKALMNAVLYGHLPIINVLLESQGAAITGRDKEEALLQAAAYGRHEIVNALLRHRAEVEPNLQDQA